jgi:transcription initiation factor TFIIE subunit alpha
LIARFSFSSRITHLRQTCYTIILGILSNPRAKLFIMDAAKTLIRTVVRSFYSEPKQILIIDALLIHSVLHADDLSILLSAQQKDIRKLVVPLKKAQLLDSHSKVEAKIGQTRGAPRDYYYIPFHPAIDAIKFRITKLTDKVKELYKPQTERKEYRCPRCKSEYDTFQVLNYHNDEGFSCEKCGTTLEETPQVAGIIGHEKHSLLMDQLGKILSLMQQVDRLQIPENDFDTAWENKKEVPRARGQHARREYVTVPGSIKVAKAGRTGPEKIKAETLGISLTSEEDHDAAEEARRQAKKAELAKQNMLPVWHTQSTVSSIAAGAVPAEDLVANGNVPKKEEDVDDQKPVVDEEDDLANYRREMQREKEEAERRAAEEDLDSDDGDEDSFEDVISTGVGTPLPGITTPAPSFQQQQQLHPTANGVKREFDSDSGPSSDANTPAAGTPSANDGSDREMKRVKFENGVHVGKNGKETGGVAVVKKQEESDDEEEDFEDAM